MIPFDYITGWRAEAPWFDDAQVEQDLVVSRAQVEQNLALKMRDGAFRRTSVHCLRAAGSLEETSLRSPRPDWPSGWFGSLLTGEEQSGTKKSAVQTRSS